MTLKMILRIIIFANNDTDDYAFKYGVKLGEHNISGECNDQSTMAWIILIQYFLLVKLFLPSILTAMFSTTGQRISAQSEQLWMFQRYEIVIEYEIRSTFPPPFNLFCYLFMLIKLLWNVITCCWKRVFLYRRVDTKKSDKEIKQKKQEKRFMNVQHYWKNFAQSHEESQKEESDKKNLKFIITSLNKIHEEINKIEDSNKHLTDLFTQKTIKSTLFDQQRNFIHILSRESPYITTNISRWFVDEKYVPWECSHDLCDPEC